MSDTVTSSSPQYLHAYQPSEFREPDPNQVIRVKSSKMYRVKIETDSYTCSISGICVTASGELIIADKDNKKVKLLDQTYKAVAHCDLSNVPYSMCSIDSSQVAVALYNSVHFIRVTNGKLVQERTLKPQHACKGIAHHQGNLYFTSGTALYHYNVDGTLVSEMYEGTTPRLNSRTTVTSCAVSPDGDRIYVLNWESGQLVTLSRDGKVISKLTDPALTIGRISILYISISSCLHVHTLDKFWYVEPIQIQSFRWTEMGDRDLQKWSHRMMV
ncbi:uncharacterized protein LOC127870781 [Dreissena polymorpha]|uniref:uncharacterized protein LOC127870781 n=1 Tax=Dreissena polymorpha TaxID=45954 RepID=UPI0022644ADB|nr:uncharacterized protein LOC127870781 [Dreissena polymorpha]